MSNSTSASADDHQQAATSASNYGTDDNNFLPQYNFSTSLPQTSSDNLHHHQPPLKKKRNLPGNPDPEAEVIALSPKTLQTTNRFICEICNKGFPRDQNLQLHRRGHNLPWKLKQRASKEVRKKVYVCPEVGCVHHDPSRALGDLTGIKKHFFRKHGEKKWKCDKCSKKYAVQSDWKAHSKTCGTREYRCDCGTLFSRRDSFITHRAFCDALAEESARATTSTTTSCMITSSSSNPLLLSTSSSSLNLPHHQFLSPSHDHQHQHHHQNPFPMKKEQQQQDHSNQLIPPWLVDHSLLPSSTYSIFSTSTTAAATATTSSKGLIHQKQNPNPNHMGPTIIDNNYQIQQQAAAMSLMNNHSNMNMMISPHISATALLQKAAQMGATLSATSASSQAPILTSSSSTTTTTNISSSRDHHQSSSSAHVPASNSARTASGLLSYNEMMMMNSGLMMGPTSSHHEPSSFEQALHSSITVGGNYEGMTRDFLGLRPLSHTDILTINAAFGNCLNTGNNNDSGTSMNSQISSTTHHQVNDDHDHDPTHKSAWQDSKF